MMNVYVLGVFGFSCFVFQSHPGKLKSPAATMNEVFILMALSKLRSN